MSKKDGIYIDVRNSDTFSKLVEENHVKKQVITNLITLHDVIEGFNPEDMTEYSEAINSAIELIKEIKPLGLKGVCHEK